MCKAVLALGVLAIVLLAVPATALADERADWGVTVSVGWEDMTLLVQNDSGFALLVLDADATIVGAGLGPMTLTDIRPGDRLDYQVVDWAGMNVVDVLHVTPHRRAELH